MKYFVRIVYCLVLFACAKPAENRKSDAPILPDSNRSSAQALTVPVPNATQVALTADAIITTKTAYYIGGPQQSRPPEGQFEAGTRVIVAEDNGAYLLVTDKKGLTAWVTADAVSREPNPRSKEKTEKR